MRCEAVNSGTRCFRARHCDDGDAPMACHGLPACFQTSPRFGLCLCRGSVRAEKRFRAWRGPELEAYRPALSEAVLDRDSVWDTCKTCSRTTKMPQHPIARPAAAVPLSCRSFSPSPTSDDGRGATRETHRILIALPDARSCLGIADADPDDRRKHGAPTGRNRHLRVLSRSSLPVLSGCPHRRGRLVLHVRVIPLRR